ncbi:low molecular weight protein-tyrosine-phosphatase [Actinokineospora enzanensis]|uniref:low molecular weight protein-tyrosine-phosphatase n=1 Tax=Actinokineospora enzanensis TaxID=155975 RepID=UPI00035FF717|nr:low molecular weight protein-tyrosine-phosphatase [Actinokineospora enzanensis]
MHICFVCTGNICRSPMAALVFGEHLRRAGLAERVRVTSAGLDDWHVGEPADPRTARVLARHGYPTAHVATQVDADHLGADLLVAMDSGHAKALRARVSDPERVTLCRVFDPATSTNLDIPDPYYGPPKGFEAVLALVEAACPGLLDWVRENRG